MLSLLGILGTSSTIEVINKVSWRLMSHFTEQLIWQLSELQQCVLILHFLGTGIKVCLPDQKPLSQSVLHNTNFGIDSLINCSKQFSTSQSR